MNIKGVIDEDFINYRKPSMVIMFPNCTFKCDKECRQQVCQNNALVDTPNINIEVRSLVHRYVHNSITRSVVMAGLEPFDSFEDVMNFITVLRNEYRCDDDVVIYTGYKENEIEVEVSALKSLKNIIIKFGRFVPGQAKHYDEILGVSLASDNQYAKVIGD